MVCLFCACGASSHPQVVTIEPEVERSRLDPYPALTPEEIAPQKDEAPLGVFHRVDRGQTLWRIARTYEVELDRIVEANAITEPARLEVGDMVWIPGVPDVLEVEAYVPGPIVAAGEWIWPVRNGRVLSGFGAQRRTHRHGGIDIQGAAGQPVLASRGGRVAYSGSGLRGYGKTVIVNHGEGLQSLYAHNSALLVAVGDRVERGQAIARVGRSGNATTEHCHFEIRLNDRRVDPMRWLKSERRAAR